MIKTKQRRKPPAESPAPPLPPAEAFDISALGEEARQQVRRLLVEGCTVEDVADMLLSQFTVAVSPAAVQTFYNSDRNIARDRAVHQVETVRELKQALRDETSPLTSLAEAALLTGVMGLSRRGEMTSNDAHRRLYENRITWLREANEKMKNKLYFSQVSLNDARRAFELIKYHETKLRCKKMKSQLSELCQSRDLTPETLHRIKEIYGIVREPFDLAKHHLSESGDPGTSEARPRSGAGPNPDHDFADLDRLLGPEYNDDFDVLGEPCGPTDPGGAEGPPGFGGDLRGILMEIPEDYVPTQDPDRYVRRKKSRPVHSPGNEPLSEPPSCHFERSAKSRPASCPDGSQDSAAAGPADQEERD